MYTVASADGGGGGSIGGGGGGGGMSRMSWERRCCEAASGCEPDARLAAATGQKKKGLSLGHPPRRPEGPRAIIGAGHDTRLISRSAGALQLIVDRESSPTSKK